MMLEIIFGDMKYAYRQRTKKPAGAFRQAREGRGEATKGDTNVHIYEIYGNQAVALHRPF